MPNAAGSIKTPIPPGSMFASREAKQHVAADPIRKNRAVRPNRRGNGPHRLPSPMITSFEQLGRLLGNHDQVASRSLKKSWSHLPSRNPRRHHVLRQNRSPNGCRRQVQTPGLRFAAAAAGTRKLSSAKDARVSAVLARASQRFPCDLPPADDAAAKPAVESPKQAPKSAFTFSAAKPISTSSSELKKPAADDAAKTTDTPAFSFGSAVPIKPKAGAESSPPASGAIKPAFAFGTAKPSRRPTRQSRSLRSRSALPNQEATESEAGSIS